MTTLIPKYDQGATGAVNRPINQKLAETVSVKDFGAIGDGSADDTAAIQAALNASKSVYIPAGTYKITSTLTLTSHMNVFGAGYKATILNGSTLANTSAILSYTGGDQFSSISNIGFVGAASGSNAIGIKVNNGYYASYTNLQFINMSYGMYLDEAGSCLIQNCHFTNCLFGAQCMGGSAYSFDACQFQYGTDVGIRADKSPTSGYPTGINVFQSGFTSNIGVEVPLVTGSYGGNIIAVDSCYFEGDSNFSTLTKAFSIGDTGTGNNVVMAAITNCRIAGSNSAKSVFSNTGRLYFANNIVGAAMQVDNTVLGAEYIGNEFDGAFTNNTLAQMTIDLGTINTNWIDNTSYGQLALTQNGTYGVLVQTTRLLPNTDNYLSLGDNVHRWTSVWAVNGTIQTSDQNEKQQIASLTTAEQAVAKTLKGLIKTFKFNDAVKLKGENARIHCGIIAQDVAKAFVDNNLDPAKYGVFCSDTWYEVDGKAQNADGIRYTKETPNAVEITRLGVRYDELFAFIIGTL